MNINIDIESIHCEDEKWFVTRSKSIISSERLNKIRFNPKLQIKGEKLFCNKIIIKIFLRVKGVDEILISIENNLSNFDRDLKFFGWINAGNSNDAKIIFFDNKIKIYENKFYYIYKRLDLRWFDECVGNAAFLKESDLKFLLGKPFWNTVDQIWNDCLNREDTILALEKMNKHIHYKLKRVCD